MAITKQLSPRQFLPIPPTILSISVNCFCLVVKITASILLVNLEPILVEKSVTGYIFCKGWKWQKSRKSRGLSGRPVVDKIERSFSADCHVNIVYLPPGAVYRVPLVPLAPYVNDSFQPAALLLRDVSKSLSMLGVYQPRKYILLFM